MRNCGEKTPGVIFRTTLENHTRCLFVLAVLLAAGVHAQAQDANLYKQALTREAALRADLAELRAGEPVAAVLQRIRVMVGAYEDIAQLFPSSDYGDNALWQGG